MNYINLVDQVKPKQDLSHSTLPRRPYCPPKPETLKLNSQTMRDRSSYGTLPKRVPLPSYDEVQAQRRRGTYILPPKYSPNRSSTLGRPSDGSQISFSHPADRQMVKPFDAHGGLDSNTTNGGSCSSSNPDSGYGGHTTDITGNDINAAFYQAGRSPQSKVVTAKAVFPTFSPPSVRRTVATPIHRVVHSNMTSDV